jgi:hypothetical protein
VLDDRKQVVLTLLLLLVQYWASCLKTYKGQFRFPAVQRYLHDLTGEMSEQLDSITSSLSYFTEVGQWLSSSLYVRLHVLMTGRRTHD